MNVLLWIDKRLPSVSIDLTNLLKEWPYEPGQVNVRIIEGDDGRAKVQMRLDLGVIQMEMSGRPDGDQPHGCESLLEYYEQLIEEMAIERSLSEEEAGFSETEGEEAEADDPVERALLSPEDCRMLREEAIQYYHRYVALLVLGEHDGVIRDTTRNLRVLELCARFAQSDEDRAAMEQFRPYITMMQTRAYASQMIEENEGKAALAVLDDGIDLIRDVYERWGEMEEFEQTPEIQLLRGMRDELVMKLPASQKNELRERLRLAIEHENYELAAILRDELRMMRIDRPEPPPGPDGAVTEMGGRRIE